MFTFSTRYKRKLPYMPFLNKSVRCRLPLPEPCHNLAWRFPCSRHVFLSESPREFSVYFFFISPFALELVTHTLLYPQKKQAREVKPSEHEGHLISLLREITCCTNTKRATITAAFAVCAVRHLVGSITGEVLNVSTSQWDVTVTIKSKAVMREELFAVWVHR